MSRADRPPTWRENTLKANKGAVDAEAAPKVGDLGPLLKAAERYVRGPRSASVLGGVTVAAAAYQAVRGPVQKLLKHAKEQVTYQVSVGNDDDIYDRLHAWLLEQMPPKAQRALVARTHRRWSDGAELASADGRAAREAAKARAALKLFYDGTKSHKVQIGSHVVTVTVSTQDTPIRNMDGHDSVRTRERIQFTMTGEAARDEVICFLRDVAEEVHLQRREPHMFIASRWGGGWDTAGDVPGRQLDTVILEAGQIERVCAGLEEFLSLEQAYANCGLPWHRGYLFHGPPGTGKTSLARALSLHFDLDVFYMPLSDMNTDTDLLQTMARINERSVLILEDVDVVHATGSRDDAETTQRISLSGLLNALDGFMTPHGLITIMTTNAHAYERDGRILIEGLDPALTRPGRVDAQEKLGYLDGDQYVRLVKMLMGDDRLFAEEGTLINFGELQITHAEIVEVAKPYLSRPRMIPNAVNEFVFKRMPPLEVPGYTGPGMTVER